MDGELALQEGWLYRGLTLKGNVVQTRSGQGLQVQARAYMHCSFTEEVDSLKFHGRHFMSLLYPKCLPTSFCVMAPKEYMMHNSQKFC